MSVWFAKVPVGAKTLTTFMSDLSKKCNLSKIYTNHSIRATGATMLSKGMYGPPQIMAVTGHKSVQSLTVYQRVDEDEKLKMGQSISEALLPSAQNQLSLPSSSNPGRQLALPSTSTIGPQLALPPTSTIDAQLALPSTSTSSDGAQPALLENENANILEGININDLFDNFFSNTNVSNTAMQSSQRNPTIFNNCQFSFNFNINKM
jgi:hypothetical protein